MTSRPTSSRSALSGSPLRPVDERPETPPPTVIGNRPLSECSGDPKSTRDPTDPSDGPAAREFATLSRCVGDVERFRRTIWGTRPHLFRSDDLWPRVRPPFADVLTLADIDPLLARSARVPSVRMVRDGTPLSPAAFCSPVRLGGRWLDDVVDPRQVARQLDDGATLVLQSLHRTSASVASFVGNLQAELSHPAQANAYLTPPSAAGLTEHADRHDVLALQLHGTKQWWVEGLGDVVMETGDVLYLPSGTRHRASTSTCTSLHLTIGIISVTRRAVLERILAGAPELDTPLPIGYRHLEGRHRLGEAVADALFVARNTIDDVDLDAVVDAEQGRRLSTRATGGRVVSQVEASDLTTDHVIGWLATSTRVASDGDGHGDGRPGDSAWMEPPTRFTLHLDDRSLTLPSSTREAVRLLLERGSVRVSDLPGLDAPSRVVLARRLVKEGACAIVTAPIGVAAEVSMSRDTGSRHAADNDQPTTNPTPEEGNTMSGEKDQATGRVKQAAGDLTGDDELKREGEKDEAAGKVKDTIDKAKDKIDDAVDSVKNKSK